MSKALTTMSAKLADKFEIESDQNEIVSVLRSTCFKGNASNEQMVALMVVAVQYGLNPWTKEIYAFPDKNNGIVPVVGVDGWARIINNHAQFDGIEFEQDDESCTCIIYRKDRSKPIKVTEYLSECRRNTGPWQSHPKRMLRHKAMIQCSRIAFGYVGIYDDDEAQVIQGNSEKDITPAKTTAKVSSITAKMEAEEATDDGTDWDSECLVICKAIADASNSDELAEAAGRAQELPEQYAAKCREAYALKVKREKEKANAKAQEQASQPTHQEEPPMPTESAHGIDEQEAADLFGAGAQ